MQERQSAAANVEGAVAVEEALVALVGDTGAEAEVAQVLGGRGLDFATQARLVIRESVRP